MTRFLSALLLLVLAAPATAELYKWTDSNGRVHFSDTAPAQKQKAEVLKAPVAIPPGAPSSPAATAPGTDDADRRMRERRLTEAWRQEAEQKERDAAEAAAKQAERAAKCADLRNSLQAAEGRPVYITNANGEKEFLDEATRRQYTDKASRYLQDHCP
jgi:hypothetical protein